MMRKTLGQLVTGLTLAVGITLLASAMWAQDAATQSQQQPGDQAQAQQSALKSFEGKVVKQGEHYLLKDSANKVTYVLDGQDEVKQYEGKEVTVIGSLDSASNTIHVQKIQTPA